MESLTYDTWMSLRDEHASLLQPRVDAHLQRRSCGEKHPVHDFLFEYYSFRPAQLMRWSPGVGIVLENTDIDDWSWGPFETYQNKNSVWLNPHKFLHSRIESAQWILSLLKEIEVRAPQFACHGLHEWAMVVDEGDIRHTQLPLRLSHDAIVTLVKSQSLCCTHYDAFRFFSQNARPWNRHQLNPGSRINMEQRGCLHTNMDLYKWAYKFYPWISSEIIRAAFNLAWDIRIIDMRASPYDVSRFNLEAIPIETEEGRRQYELEQKRLSEKSIHIRRMLSEAYEKLLGL